MYCSAITRESYLLASRIANSNCALLFTNEIPKDEPELDGLTTKGLSILITISS